MTRFYLLSLANPSNPDEPTNRVYAVDSRDDARAYRLGVFLEFDDGATCTTQAVVLSSVFLASLPKLNSQTIDASWFDRLTENLERDRTLYEDGILAIPLPIEA